MSDIPLRSFRRNQARSNYIPLADNDVEARNSHSGSRSSDKPDDMPTTSITKASVASGNARRSGKARGKDRYLDDPEEGERLLGGSYDGSDEGVEEPERPPSPAKVCLSIYYWDYTDFELACSHVRLRCLLEVLLARTSPVQSPLTLQVRKNSIYP